MTKKKCDEEGCDRTSTAYLYDKRLCQICFLRYKLSARKYKERIRKVLDPKTSPKKIMNKKLKSEIQNSPLKFQELESQLNKNQEVK